MDTYTKTLMATLKGIMRANKVPAIIGDPGVGKTATIHQLCEDEGLELITLLGSAMDPTDVAGFPKEAVVMLDEDGNPVNGTVYLAPDWQVKTLQKKNVLIFMDEYSNAPGSVRAGFLTILHNRVFPNGMKMPDEAKIIIAMNPPEQAADGYEMDLPTSNRLCWLTWDPTLEAWLEGMRNAWGKEVSENEQRWKNLVAGFIEENPTYLHKMPSSVSGRAGGKTNSPQALGVNPNNPSEMMCFRSAWPSRRSWDNLSATLAVCDKSKDVQDTIIRGFVGFEAASFFRDWLNSHESDLRVDRVMKDPNAVDWKQVAPDSAHRVLRNMLQSLTPANCADPVKVKVVKNGKAAPVSMSYPAAIIYTFKVLSENDRADLGAPFIQDLIKSVMDRKKVPDKTMRDENIELMHQIFALYQNISKKSD